MIANLYIMLWAIGHHFATANAYVGTCLDTDSNSAQEVCNTGLPKVEASNANLQTILQYTFGVIAALAALIIVIAGLRLVVNAGEADAVAKLRKTIIYAAVGLVIAIFADVLVGWVLNNI